MVPVRSLLRPLYLPRKILTSSVHGKRLNRRYTDRTADFMDSVSVLFCRIRKVDCGRHSPGYQRHAAVYGSHFYGFDAACGPCFFLVRPDTERCRYLVRVACGLDNRYGNFYLFLPKGMPEISEVTATFPCSENLPQSKHIRNRISFYKQYSEFKLHKVPVLHKPKIRVKQYAHIRGGNLHTAAAICPRLLHHAHQ